MSENLFSDDSLSNGRGAAAILAAGIGSATLGVLAFAGDAVAPLGRLLSIWPPRGPLSGVTTLTVIVWLASWRALGRRWRDRTVALGWVTVASFALLATGLLLTFPPLADRLQGR
ncbi:MAG TPA: hypothetical protein VHO91_16400 [Rhodopila sp.]|nr:hypothetical protein [Rhodopila sp.]